MFETLNFISESRMCNICKWKNEKLLKLKKKHLVTKKIEKKIALFFQSYRFKVTVNSPSSKTHSWADTEWFHVKTKVKVFCDFQWSEVKQVFVTLNNFSWTFKWFEVWWQKCFWNYKNFQFYKNKSVFEVSMICNKICCDRKKCKVLQILTVEFHENNWVRNFIVSFENSETTTTNFGKFQH